MTRKEQVQQIRKEACWTGLALLVLIIFWLLAGFGIADLNVTVLGLPLWTITSSIGVWFFALLLVKFLTTFIFKDMTFDKDGDN